MKIVKAKSTTSKLQDLHKFTKAGLMASLLVLGAAGISHATEPKLQTDKAVKTQINNGFGDSYFANEGHPGFGGDIDAEAAAAIAPAAGDETAEDVAPGDTVFDTEGRLDVEITDDAAPAKIPAPVID